MSNWLNVHMSVAPVLGNCGYGSGPCDEFLQVGSQEAGIPPQQPHFRDLVDPPKLPKLRFSNSEEVAGLLDRKEGGFISDLKGFHMFLSG